MQYQISKNVAFLLFSLFFISACTTKTSHQQNVPDISPTLATTDLENIYVFGDSLSDNGNFFSKLSELSGFFNVRLQSPPASSGGTRLSNKFLVVEYLAAHYGIALQPAWETGAGKNNAVTLGKDIKDQKIKLTHLIATKSPPSTREFNKSDFSDYHRSYLSEVVKNHKAAIRKDIDHTGLNYAFASASIARYDGLLNDFLSLYSLPKQLDLHLKNIDSNDIASDNTLHMIIMGGNDIMHILASSSDTSMMMEKVDEAVEIYTEQVSRLIDAGAKKVILSTSPMIGEIPAFYNTKFSGVANQLSTRLESEVVRNLSDNHFKGKVKFVSISQIFSDVISRWPDDARHLNCISDFANGGHFSLSHFILTDGELETSFENGCNENLLSDGQFAFFDVFHGSDTLYRLFVPSYIAAVNSF